MKELGEEARRLLDMASRADAPAQQRVDEIERALWPKLTIAGAVLSSAKLATGAATAAPAAKSAALGTLASYFLAGSAGGVSVAILSAALAVSSPTPAPPSVPAASLAPATQSAPVRGPAPVAEHVTLPSESPPSPSAPPIRPRTPQLQRSVDAGTPERPTQLAEEVRLLNEVQSALSAGDGTRALAASDRYVAEFRGGLLQDEHVAARVLVLCSLGQVQRAHDALRMFVARSPQSPLMPRLARSCAADSAR